jgi:hypothetical protein
MTRNEKIALGCGIAVIVGLFVLGVICGLAVFVWRRQGPIAGYNRNYNFNSNYNSGRNLNSAPDSPSSRSQMTENEKHRLFQAASVTGDPEVVINVGKKLGLMDSNGNPNSEYWKFTGKHVGWAMRESEFMSSVSTPEKAQAYVDAHMND